jgi:signal transduction histidine kinase
MMQHRIQHEGFSIKKEIGNSLPVIKIDKSAISQAIYNLLDNAIKFSDKKSEIILRGFSKEGFINISVQDFGVGIKSEELDKIFDRFYL